MIDRTTGEVTFLDVSIRPALSHSEFQDSELFKKATPIVINGPWASYRVDLERGGMVLQFKDSKIVSISIGFNFPDENLKASWGSWSQENEKKRKQLHDQILRQEIGSIYRKFSWGEVGSIVDPKTCDASIFVQYL